MFWIQKSNGCDNSGYRLFYAETEDDTKSLPTNSREGTQKECDSSINLKCAIGSECFIIETGKVKILTSIGWKEV